MASRHSGADAGPADKLHRIGVLERTSPTVNAANLEAFRQGLRDLGYVEGRSFVLEYRSAEGQDDRLPALAGELLRELVPKASRIAVLFNMGNPALPPQWKEVEAAARMLGVEGSSSTSPRDVGCPRSTLPRSSPAA